MKRFSKKDQKELFERIFKGFNLKDDDVVVFKNRGKILWRVDWKTNKGFLIVSLGPKYCSRYLYPKDYLRIRKVTGLELVRWLLRNRPTALNRLVKSEKLRKRWIRKLVPKGTLEDL